MQIAQTILLGLIALELLGILYILSLGLYILDLSSLSDPDIEEQFQE